MVKKLSFSTLFRKYLEKGIKLEKYQKVGILFLVVVVAGFVGWLYEFLLAWAERGEIYMQGGNILPWINIYAIGAILVVPMTYRIRKHPWAVFLVSVLVTGVVELVGGWLVYVLFDGARYWNYDYGLWAIGSINGFVCPLSVMVFGIGSLMLVYFVVPFCICLAQKMTKRAFLTLAITLFVLVIADEVGNLLLKVLKQLTAVELYESWGFKYL